MMDSIFNRKRGHSLYGTNPFAPDGSTNPHYSQPQAPMPRMGGAGYNPIEHGLINRTMQGQGPFAGLLGGGGGESPYGTNPFTPYGTTNPHYDNPQQQGMFAGLLGNLFGGN